jgi:hypothetical protein
MFSFYLPTLHNSYLTEKEQSIVDKTSIIFHNIDLQQNLFAYQVTYVTEWMNKKPNQAKPGPCIVFMALCYNIPCNQY